jgi:hypothetical protein
MSPIARRNFRIFVAAVLLVAACLLFPRVLAFVELAARELRYMWWLVLIAALGVWLAFFYNRKND